MYNNTILQAGGGISVLLAAGLLPGQAMAQDGPAQSIEIEARHTDYDQDYGSIDTVRLEYKLEWQDTTVVVTPEAGERTTPDDSRSAVGIGATIYHDLSDSINSMTRVAIAEDEPVFAQYDVAQELTFDLLPQTTGTLGARWARYFGDRDVYFVNAGARYYFRGGSVSYRLSYVDPDNRDGFLAHLANLALKDGRGDGVTQLWLSYGASAIDRTPLDQDFSGEDYGAFLRRVQPVGGGLNLIAGAGVNSYDRPDDRVTATKFSLGLNYRF